jgi:hypothetical protein
MTHAAATLNPATDHHATEEVRVDLPSTTWSLGRLIPLTLLVWAALDILPRFFPLEWLQINPFQLAARVPGRYAPFAPNLSIDFRQYVGELSLMANLPPTETRPPLRFTTDNLGFRVTPAAGLYGKPQIVLMEGDSFTFGAALSDEETFSTGLSRELGVNVYNGGRYFTDPERLKEMDWLFAKLQMEGRPTVIYVMLETFELSLARELGEKPVDRVGKRILGVNLYTSLKEEYRFLSRLNTLWWPVSPLRVVSRRLYKSISNDRILPNPYKASVGIRYLPGGQQFLFEPRYLDRYLNPPDDRAATDSAEYLAWLGDQFAERNMDFWVLLVPESISVYAPWLLLESERPVKWQAHYLDRLEAELQKRKLKTCNTLPHLSRYAAEDIRTGELSYYREDHHWNPKGVRMVSEAMAQALRAGGFTQKRAVGDLAAR